MSSSYGPFGPLSQTFTLAPGELARMRAADAARAAAGYTVDPSGLASRVGELRAVADSVASAVSMLTLSKGDLGPGNLPGAVEALRGQWLDGLRGVRERIEAMATTINGANANYTHVEDAAQQSFTTKFGVAE
ncbi:MAG TPA: hypothetical protein VH352_28185 [Pseudonocardiaceae bacterium]|jgi:hypothetical protein|nr:hypothetical protein [Pseudonocardiaceae bacterium]